LNLVLDPLLIFATPLRVCGAALATSAAETLSGLTYLHLLLKRNLVSMKLLFRQPPSWSSLRPLITSGLSVLGRQLVLNFGMLAAARRAQSMDPTTGVAAAAYGIVMQMYILGVVVHVALQGTAAALVPAALAQKSLGINTTETSTSSSTTTSQHSPSAVAVVGDGKERARQVADRTFGWGILVGIMLAVAQYVALPFLVPLFSTLPQVQEAVRRPALLLSLLHIVNGPVFVGEGIMLGLGSFRDLLLVTGVGILTMVACLASPLGARLDGILMSFVIFSAVQAVGVLAHYLRIGPLAVRRPHGLGKDKSGKQSLRARLKGIRLAFGR
jgi:Na+-driven multidrug efflux pump